MDERSDVIFHEEQKFSKWVYWLIIVVTIISIGSITVAIKTESAEGNIPSAGELFWLIIGMVIPVIIAALFVFLKLETEVRPDGLYVRFFPFHINFKIFSPEDLSEAYARQYKPISEYGGWGIRGFGKNKAYNTSGNEGVQLVFENGKKLLIGSQKAKELEEAIQSIMR
jgi:hypothetical protein